MSTEMLVIAAFLLAGMLAWMLLGFTAFLVSVSFGAGVACGIRGTRLAIEMAEPEDTEWLR